MVDLRDGFSGNTIHLIGHVGKHQQFFGGDITGPDILPVQVHEIHPVDALSGTLCTDLLKAGILGRDLCCLVRFHAGRRFDLEEHGLAVARYLDGIRPREQAIVGLEHLLKIDCAISGVLKELPDVPLDLVAFARELLHERGEFAVGVVLRVPLEQPERLRAIQNIEQNPSW